MKYRNVLTYFWSEMLKTQKKVIKVSLLSLF